MSINKKYWKNIEELSPSQSEALTSLKHKEFVQEIPVDEFLGDKSTLESSSTTRRDFLKYVGFSTAAASLAACEGPVVKSIPYVVQPEQIIPGVANYYATAISNGYDFASLLVKTREGRPIKVESNSLAKANEVSYFKYTRKKFGEGKRIFKMSPLHHHYQKLGYHESKIVTRFWIVGILLAILTIVTLKIR